MIFFQSVTQAFSENEIPSRTYDLPITSSDALPLSYRRLVGAKAIKGELKVNFDLFLY